MWGHHDVSPPLSTPTFWRGSGTGPWVLPRVTRYRRSSIRHHLGSRDSFTVIWDDGDGSHRREVTWGLTLPDSPVAELRGGDVQGMVVPRCGWQCCPTASCAGWETPLMLNPSPASRSEWSFDLAPGCGMHCCGVQCCAKQGPEAP